MGEAKRLDAVATWYDPRTDFDRHTRRRIAALIEEHRHGTRLLEVGCGTGAMTRYLTGEITAIDGSPKCIEECLKQSWDPPIRFEECMAEEFAVSGDRFDDVVMAGLLEHVEDPLHLLRKAKEWLVPGGRVHISVPNALSLHRRIGVAMGMLPALNAMTKRDHAMAHRRIYKPDELSAQLHQANWRIIHWEGVLLKPLSSAQMNDWPDERIDAFIAVGRSLPEWCAELYFVCA
jgi:2-polyprenyl-3-methyl-5-hydroxy-6-metoxy-1,4-benzoquinol methylase